MTEATLYRACPTCEPDGGTLYHDLMDAILDYQGAADDDCWRCDGEGLLVGPPDAWEASYGPVVTVREMSDD